MEKLPNSLPGKEKLAFLADVHTDGKHRTGHARTSTVSRVYQRHVVRWNCREILGSSARALRTTQQCSLAPRASRSVVNCTLPKSSIYAVLSVDLCRNLQRLNLRESKRLATGYRQLFAHHQPRAWPRFALLAQPPQIVFEIGCCRMVDSDSASASARVNCIRGVPKKSSPSPFN